MKIIDLKCHSVLWLLRFLINIFSLIPSISDLFALFVYFHTFPLLIFQAIIFSFFCMHFSNSIITCTSFHFTYLFLTSFLDEFIRFHCFVVLTHIPLFLFHFFLDDTHTNKLINNKVKHQWRLCELIVCEWVNGTVVASHHYYLTLLLPVVGFALPQYISLSMDTSHITDSNCVQEWLRAAWDGGLVCWVPYEVMMIWFVVKWFGVV